MNTHWHAIREDRERGHVAKLPVPYVRRDDKLPQVAQDRQPWLVVFFDELGPMQFICFGGKGGMESTVEYFLGPKLVTASGVAHHVPAL